MAKFIMIDDLDMEEPVVIEADNYFQACSKALSRLNRYVKELPKEEESPNE